MSTVLFLFYFSLTIPPFADWREIYAPQGELLTYIAFLIKRWKLEPLMQFNSSVTDCIWDDDKKNWTIKVQVGPKNGDKETQTWKGRHLILATGCLSAPQLPKFNGLDEFKGETYHTGQWPKDGVDFTGKKVAVIGTGSSAIQSIPIIAQQADSLVVFQRTANYSVPAHNRQLSEEDVKNQKVNYESLKKASAESAFGAGSFPAPEKAFADYKPEEIDAHLDKFWALGGLSFMTCFTDVITNMECNNAVKDYIHRKIKSLVTDEEVAKLLCPEQPVGCKRLCVDTDYYITYNRPNVKLVNIKGNPLKTVGGADGKIVLEDGSSYGPFDAIVTATGL